MRYAVRLLLKTPGFTAVAVVSLSLGIGANTLMFSIVHAVLLRSLPYPGSDRLVFVWFTPPNHPEQKRPASAADFFALREQSRVLEHVGTVGGVDDTATLTGGPGDLPEQVEGQRFSAAVPLALGAKPLLGRWFTAPETEAEANSVVVISYRLWQRRFGGAADVLGKIVRLDGEAAAIIGVMPDGWMLFNYPAQFWAPYRLVPAARGSPDRVLPLARLKPGVTMRQAQEEMNRFAAGLAETFPSTNKGWGIRLEPALDVYVGWIRQPLLIVQGVVALVLLIACANVAGLLLAQAAARKKEVAVRAALGAGHWRIARQFLTESILLSLLGGLLGTALAYGGLKLFVAISPAWFPRIGEIVLDIRTLCFTALLSLATGLVFGVIPALQASGSDLIEIMKETTRGIERQRLRSALVVVEMSVALMLLIGAGLMLNTFLRLYNAPTGCDTRNLITFQVRLPAGQFVKNTSVIGDNHAVEISPRVNGVFEQIRERISGFPGVASVAAGIRPPLSESTLGDLTLKFTIDGQPTKGLEKEPVSAAWFPVSAGYFHTLHTPLVRGREFGIQDTAASLPVVLINEAMARRFWSGEDPIGKRLLLDMVNEPIREIVGVVGDVRHNRYDREAQPQMYVPYVQHPLVSQGRWVESRLTMTFVVRSAGDALRLVPTLRTAVAEVDRNLPIFNIKTLDEYVAEQIWQPQQTLTLLAIFGAIAVVLAMTGVYGIMAYAIQQRTHEIGIRMALGASRRDVLRLVIARGLQLVALGVTIGLAGSLALTRLLGTLLWGVTPTDPLTYVVVIMALVTVAMLACYVPARRALEIEPTVALRYE
jgi:putative ABC transport system permease protein